MKYIKLLLFFIVIFALAACSQAPFGEGLFYIKGDNVGTTEEQPQNDEGLNDDGDPVNPEDEYIEHDDEDKLEALDKIDDEDKEDKTENDEIHESIEDDEGKVSGDEVNDEEAIEEKTEGPEEPILVTSFNTQLPEKIGLQLKYDQYPVDYDYLLILKNSNIRELPDSNSKILGKGSSMKKIKLIAEVKGQYLNKWDNDSWYRVEWQEKEETLTGYIFSGLAEPRHFQFDKMSQAIEELEERLDYDELAHISNYKNRNGIPPKIDGSTSDSYGHRRSQSAAGYTEPDKSSEYRYIPDGMLLHVLEEKDEYTKVKVVDFEGEYWVLNKYINRDKTITKLNKVVVVDRKYQNQGVFELENGEWNLISYGFSTTGKPGKYSLPTPLGYYMFIEKRDRFYYFKDGTKEIAGYAPYAARFSGGGYIHGVPVNYKMEGDKKIDPGKQEYLHSIGTVPKSHMCIRNYTSHAKFIHSWIDIGETAIVVIE